jgi:hypothetical protein
VRSNAEPAAVLRRIAEPVSRDADMGWSVYEAGELRSEIRSFPEKAEADLPFDETEYKHLRFLFASADPLQETSIASSWAEEFLALFARV